MTAQICLRKVAEAHRVCLDARQVCATLIACLCTLNLCRFDSHFAEMNHVHILNTVQAYAHSSLLEPVSLLGNADGTGT